MKRLALLLLCTIVSAATFHARAAEPPRHVVMISVDGLRSAYYTQADAEGLKIPNLRRLMKQGAWAKGVVGVLPTVTYPSHTSLITGVTPRVHGVDVNQIFDPEERANGAWSYYASAIRVPTLVHAARAQQLTTGAVSWPVSVGIGADFIIPEYYRPNSQHEIDRNMLELASTPHLIAAVENARGGKRFAYPWNERDRLDATIFIWKTYRPDLLLLHLIDTDSAQHANGPMSPEAKLAVEAADGHVGEFLRAIEETGMADKTLVAIVSDHGFLPVSRTLYPNTMLREAGLLTMNARGRIGDWKAVFHQTGGSAMLRLKDPADQATLDRVRAMLLAKAKDPESGIREVMDKKRIEALGGSADADLIVDAKSGFHFNNGTTGDWSQPSTSKGYHGFAPLDENLWATLILSGPGLKKKGELGVVRMTQIAPTIADYLGLVLSKQADAPLPIW